MAGLGVSEENNVVFLGIAGGKVWQKKDRDGNVIPETHPRFRTQDYEFSGETKQRKGAQYDDFSGMVTKVVVADGQFGEQLKVTMEAGGENFTFSLGTNNRNSQNFFAALLLADLTKPLYLKPYDFEGKDKVTKKLTGKRVVGIGFKQGGQKIDLTKVKGVPQATEELYKSGNKKKIKRFFEDLNDWYVEQIKSKVSPMLDSQVPSTQSKVENTDETGGPIGGSIGGGKGKVEETQPTQEEIQTDPNPQTRTPEVVKEPTIIAKRKAIKAYIADNYDGETMPKLNKEQVNDWYSLVLSEEELPFEKEEEVKTPVQEAEVPQGDLSAQLNGLLGNN